MAKASDNAYPSLLLVEQASAPSTPASGNVRIYRKTDNKLYQKDDAGTETEVGSGVGTTPTLNTYTPTVAGQTVAPTLGTGATQFGRYVDDGLYVSVDIYVKFGTTSFAAGTGYYAFLIPVTAHANDVSNLLAVGNGRYTKNSTGAATALLPALVDSTHVIAYLGGTTNILGAAQPAAMSQSDEFRLQIRYRKA